MAIGGEGQAWIDEIRAISGRDSAEARGEEGKADSFTKKYNKLEDGKNAEELEQLKEQKEKYNLNEIKKAYNKEEKFLKKEIAEKEKLPSHAKVKEVFENSTAKERLELQYKLITDAFKKTDNIEGNTLSLDKVTIMSKRSFEREMTDDGNWDNIRSKRPTPEIRVVPVEREPKGLEKFIGNPDLRTNEVLVVISLNNGDNERENTVITMVARHKGGKLIFDENHRDGLYKVQSEREYKNLVRPEDDRRMFSLEQKVARGESTIDNYRDKFRGSRGKKIDEHWEAWDKRLAAKYDERNPAAGREAAHVAETKAELLGALEGRYSKQLEALQAKGAEILRTVDNNVKEIVRRNNEILTNNEFLSLMKLFRKGTMIRGSESAEFAMTMIAEKLGISLEELTKLVEKAALGR